MARIRITMPQPIAAPISTRSSLGLVMSPYRDGCSGQWAGSSQPSVCKDVSAGLGQRYPPIPVKREPEFGRGLARRPSGPVRREVVQCCQRPGLDPVEVQDSPEVVDLVLGDSGWPAREYGREGGAMLVQGIHPH